jgi:hypothetical protein
MQRNRLSFRWFLHDLQSGISFRQAVDKDNLLFVSVCFLAILFVLLTVLNTLYAHQQYVLLAASFLEGQLHFLEEPGMWWDTSLYAGKHFWPLGPLPAVLIIPFYLMFKMSMSTGYIGLPLTFLIVWYLNKVALLYGVSGRNTRWLAFAFVFSTSFCFVNYFSNWPWYFANVLSVFLIILAMYEWQTQQRLPIVGFLLGLSMATRPMTSLVILSFIWLILNRQQPMSHKFRALLGLLLPFSIIGLLLAFYNYARFDSFLEFGYQYQLLPAEALTTRNYAVFSLRHYPMNLYYLLFKGLDGVFIPGTKMMQMPYIRPDVWGTSILLTSPILLFLMNSRPANRMIQAFLGNSLLILLVAMAFSNTGAINYGSRHVLDFLPLLFPAFVTAFQDRVSGKVKALIIFSFLFNFFMSLQTFQNVN